ncbi:hypothetical protein TRVA0_001S10132 [Trichomonascus vanleenenianus]|uniref:uncharacterized protein n=1 Tax=Trichomonascus vanleenenianus TaxID=2268995 RepID=UPI003ECB2E13
MVRRRKRRAEWDSEYKTVLQRRVPGSAAAETVSPKARKNSCQEDFSEVKEWRYLMIPGWHPPALEEEDNESSRHAIDWDNVERVMVDHDVTDIDRCPICLETPPIAPRLTRCGHIFCIVCIFKYQLLYGELCPLCNNSLRQFKPLVYSTGELTSINLNEPIDLRLHARSREGQTVVRSSCGSCVEHPDIKCDGLVHSAVARGSVEYFTNLYENELIQLSEYFAPEEQAAEYYRNAVIDIQHHIKRLCQLNPSNGPENSREDAYFYFYQPAGRQRTFLDTIDVRILLDHFGEFQRFPPTLTPILKSLRYLLVDNSVKNKYRYLNYLPSGTVIRLVSCDWTDIVSPDVLAKYSSELSTKHAPKSPRLAPNPSHPELFDEDYEDSNYYLEDEVCEDVDASEYLYDRNREPESWLVNDFEFSGRTLRPRRYL